LTILGGGGFRVPLIYRALLAEPRVTDVVLYDVDESRLAAVAAVLRQLAADRTDAPRVRVSAELTDALAGADFVFCAMRVGGTAGRAADERIALDHGLLGQETTGPGGIGYGLRTVPVAIRVAELIAELCPHAWVVNFTNPAGMVTEAMQRVLGDRVIGVCDSPAGLCRRAARALRVDPARVAFDYAGLNHLGWLRAVRQQGRDLLPELLADDAALAGIEEGRLFGAEWIRAIGALPNEYLYYYYFTREATAAMAAGDTRGEYVARQQREFYAAAAAEPERALALWDRTRAERDASYLAEARDGERDQSDVDEGGYESVALALLDAIVHGTSTTLILNVRNGSAIPALPSDAVVEVSCTVDGSGARPIAVDPLTPHQLGLVAAVKAAERATIDAAVAGSASTAVAALALHPLVDSVDTARRLLTAYRTAIPELAAVLR